jgi:hypothetical protein
VFGTSHETPHLVYISGSQLLFLLLLLLLLLLLSLQVPERVPGVWHLP